MDNNGIQYLRTLVDRYFDGNATEEEIAVLRNLAEDADGSRIADSGLLADLHLVKSLDSYSEASLREIASDMPLELTGRLDKHISNLAAVERHRVLGQHIWRAVAAVLVVAVFAVVFVLHKPWGKNVAGDNMPNLAADFQILEIELPVPVETDDNVADVFRSVSLVFDDTENYFTQADIYVGNDDEFVIVI